MVWAKIDDAILDNPKIAKVGVIGFALHIAGITWCCRNLTDGFIPRQRVQSLLDASELLSECIDAFDSAPAAAVDRIADATANCGPPSLLRFASRLLEAKLWDRDDERDGFWIHDFATYNPTRRQVEAAKSELSRKRSESGRKGGQAKRKQSGSKAEASWQANAKQSGSPDPDPDPLKISLTRARAEAPGEVFEEIAISEVSTVDVTSSPPTRKATQGGEVVRLAPPSLDEPLPEALRERAQGIAEMSGAPELDVDASWRSYVAWCAENGKPLSDARWTRWVNDDCTRRKRDRVRDRERGRSTGTGGPRRFEPDMSNHPSRRMIRDEDL